MKRSALGLSMRAIFALSLGFVSHTVQAESSAKKVGSDWEAPASAAKTQNPLAGHEKEAAALGKSLFMANCIACHGTKGDGDGPAAVALERRPSALSDAKMWKQTDGALFWKITEGKTPMPYFRDILTPEQRWQVISYIRTLSAEPKDLNPASEKKKSVAVDPNENQNSNSMGTESQKLKANEAALVEIQNELKDLRQSVLETKKMAKDAYPGTTKMLIGGYGTAGFSSPGPQQKNTEVHSAFRAAFNPLMIWKINDRILFEGELELQLEGENTTVNLELAQVSYLLNDYMTLGAGRFLIPMNFFVERQHMGWVNKFPDKPLAVYDGLLPESLLGLQLRGGFPAGPVKFEYALYMATPPTLNTADSTSYGTLQFDDLDNVNDHMAYGGRVGIFPIPQCEVGYGMQWSAVGPKGLEANALLQSVDINYVPDSPTLKGNFTLHGQWVWQNIDKVTFDADGALGFGPQTFNNHRDGGYASISYRPSFVSNNVVKNFEPGFRFDLFNQRQTPVGYDELRYAFALDYWIYQNVVVKGAYEIDRKNGVGENSDAFLAEFITGF